MSLLEIKNLNISFDTNDGNVKAVNDVNFNVEKNESFAIVGESGSGKTQLVFSILNLLAKNAKVSGSIKYESKEILNLSEVKMNRIRSEKISIIFQDPMTSLNPYMRIKNQLNEVLIHHKNYNIKEATAESIRMLDAVKIPDAKNRINMFPHEFSGGMRQRVMIAMSLLCKPSIIIADEPTTALDVTVQAQIMDLFSEIKKEFETSIILITHNMGLVEQICDKTLVLYAGRIMEYGHTKDIFLKPSHPYTRGLLEAIPRIDQEYETLKTIPGEPPNMFEKTSGCVFSSRCQNPTHDCRQGNIPMKLVEISKGHWVDQCCSKCG